MITLFLLYSQGGGIPQTGLRQSNFNGDPNVKRNGSVLSH